MSVQELLTTHDCSVPGCPDEARERGGLCRYHQAENRPTVCKVDGCADTPAGKGGPWKNYCQRHMSEEIARRQAVRYSKKPPPGQGTAEEDASRAGSRQTACRGRWRAFATWTVARSARRTRGSRSRRCDGRTGRAHPSHTATPSRPGRRMSTGYNPAGTR